VAKHGHAPRAGDGLVRAGVVLFVLGLVAIVVVFVPFATDLLAHGARHAQTPRHERGVALNLATFATCAGLGLALVGLVRQARESRARAKGG
jgi:predicted cation transporter